MAKFAQNRSEVVRQMAKKLGVPVPPEFERFFALAGAGNWDEAKALFTDLAERRKAGPTGWEKLWPAVHETYGVAEAVHDWPAQALLDYGQTVLGSLRPGMVYVGGTDAGRFIPTLLNETAEGERHIVLTQNALADATYLEYFASLYGDRLQPLTGEDSQRAFQNYLADAQKRLAHDQQFPDEPKQIRPGEDVRATDNRVQVSGQVAVMMINDGLLRMLQDKNPGLSFAVEESFRLPSTHPGAVPLGALLELDARDAKQALTAGQATQTLDYWRGVSGDLLADPEAAGNVNVRRAYAKMASAQAGLLAEQHFPAQAEDGFRLALDMAPDSVEPFFRLTNLLVTGGRITEAVQLADDFARRSAEPNPQVEALRTQLHSLQDKGAPRR